MGNGYLHPFTSFTPNATFPANLDIRCFTSTIFEDTSMKHCIVAFACISGIAFFSAQAQDIVSKLPGSTSTQGFTIKDSAGKTLLSIRGDGRIGVDTLVPSMQFTLAGDGGILATGLYGNGATLASLGTGSRFIWYPRRSAFRAGYALTNRWDDYRIGNYSVATGEATLASGAHSTAMGWGTRATGASSTALGDSTEASGASSTALGYLTTAGGVHSFAAGRWSSAPGNNSTAMGDSAQAAGSGSVALGSGTNAAGENAVALGHGTIADGPYATATGFHTSAAGQSSTAMGYLSTASGSYSCAQGYFTTAVGENSRAAGSLSHASGDCSTAWGMNVKSDAYGCTAIGRFNVGGGTANSWVDTDPVFEVGIGSSANTRMNALTVLKNGNVGIMTTEPGYPLQVAGDAAKTGGGSWSNASDIRLKVIHGPYTRGLGDILKLHSIRFHYRKDNLRRLPGNREEIGFIAQEVQDVFPECITENKDGYLDFNMHAVNVALVNAVRELNAKLEYERLSNASLSNRLATLERQVDAMKDVNKRLAAMEALLKLGESGRQLVSIRRTW